MEKEKDIGLYLHLRKFPVQNSEATKSGLEVAHEGNVQAQRFFRELEREARAAQMVLEQARNDLAHAQATGGERTHGLDATEAAYRRGSSVLLAYALFKSILGDIPKDLAACNLTAGESLASAPYRTAEQQADLYRLAGQKTARHASAAEEGTRTFMERRRGGATFGRRE